MSERRSPWLRDPIGFAYEPIDRLGLGCLQWRQHHRLRRQQARPVIGVMAAPVSEMTQCYEGGGFRGAELHRCAGAICLSSGSSRHERHSAA
jgi:hypothetical protein